MATNNKKTTIAKTKAKKKPVAKKTETTKKTAAKTTTKKKTATKKKVTTKTAAKKKVALKTSAKKKTAAKKKVTIKTAVKKKTAAKKKKTTKEDSSKKTTKKPVSKTITSKNKQKNISQKSTPKTEAEPKVLKEDMASEDVKKLEKDKTYSGGIDSKFSVGDFVIYPSHGIGKIIEIQSVKIMDKDFSCYLIYFERERLTIKVPVSNSGEVKLRNIVDKKTIEEVFDILRSGVKKMKGMWSRRAQEYESKINSGDIFALAEVLRDLARDIEDSERSYSERIIYETAITRLASEYAAIYKVSVDEAKEIVINTAKDKLGEDSKDEEVYTYRKNDDEDDFAEDEGDEETEEDDDDFEDDFDEDFED